MINFIKKWWLIFIFIIFVIILFLISVFSVKPNKQPPSVAVTPSPIFTSTPRPVSSNINEDYSNLNKLTPGKSTFEEVIKINGFPEKTVDLENNKTLYYPTPYERYKNEVIINNNVVYYVIENVFADYRGTFSTYLSAYGKASLEMYRGKVPFTWYIYPSLGIGVESDGVDVLGLLYFIPTTDLDFVKNIAPKIDLSKTQPPIE